MSRNRILLNLGLAVLVVAGAMKMTNDWEQFESGHNVASIQAKANPLATSNPAVTAPPKDAAYWKEIAERNVFSFDRSDVPVAPAASQAQGVPGKPVPYLFGTMTLGGPLTALVGPATPGNRAFRPMVVGEAIDGWTVVEIKDKSIAVERAGERQTVYVNDPTALIPRDYSRTSVAAQTVAAMPAARPSVPEIGPAPSSAPQPTAPGAVPAAPRTRVISTPFGNKVITDPEQ